MPKNQTTAAQKARAAARDGQKYTTALRGTSRGGTEPDDGFGGHEFEYEQTTDLFRCSECRVYEVMARDTDGPIAPCPGLVGYGGDTERVYLLLTENPTLPYSYSSTLAIRARSTGIGRAPRLSWRDGKLLIESAPSVVAELARRIEHLTTPADHGPMPLLASIDYLSAEEGQAVLAENYAAYVAEYGEDDD